ncbi:MAG: hypothetical protein BM564_01630 [Bacteroidetes bacterium MedPE-SWsnd-G2]|nr:MAG: hypothetical protein BM564_01630 [Bacteroidetes bacterium MedPE-SWsnd-G2]
MEKQNTLNPYNFGKLQGLIFFTIGLICGVLYSFGGLIIDCLVSLNILSAEAMSTPGLSKGTLLAFGALLGMPIISGVCGFVLGVIEALIFNYFTTSFYHKPPKL